MNRVHVWLVLAVTMIIALTTSCEHKELCYLHPHTGTVRVEFDWTESPDADVPTMSVYFYNAESGELVKFGTADADTGMSISLANGTYSVITYNSNSDAVYPGDVDNYYTHYLSTRQGAITEPSAGYNDAKTSNVPRVPSASNETVRITADRMWGCAKADIQVQVAEGEVQTITLTPRELTCTYTYEIRNVKNLSSVMRMNAALTGMSGVLYMSTGMVAEEPVTLPLYSEWNDDTIYGHFFTFGRNESDDIREFLTLYVWSTDGTQRSYGTTGTDATFDVTDQVENAPDPRNVNIVIDGLELHKSDPTSSDAGYQVTVDGWGDENHDIHM